MTGMRKVRYGILFVAVAASGIYLFVYLYRWEWHRALVAGVLFVAAEVALAAAAILDRLRSIETRLQASAAPGTAGTTDPLARLQEAAPEPRTNFDWLSRQRSELSVFVPLLLGAGVVLSGAAWIVERLAKATAGPVLERGLALRLSPLGMPAGVFAGVPVPTAPRRRSVVPHAVAAVAALAIATVGIDAMADATQNRPDTHLADTNSAVTISVDPGSARTSLAATRALWAACTTQIGGEYDVLGMTSLGGGLVQVVVAPQIGKYAERRMRGCIGDAVTDRIRAGVQSVTQVPASRS